MSANKPAEILCIGELLMDLISTEYTDDFKSADQYRRVPGGSPANLAMNLAKLGQRVGLVATVGQDDAGELLIDAVSAAGADTKGINRINEPTTLILVTKSREVSNFEAYRLADRHVTAPQISAAGAAAARILHTTAFALSTEPARSAILESFATAAARGAMVSVDFNYADKIWQNDRETALQCIRTIAGHGGLIKVSEVDFERLFGTPVTDPEVAALQILALGASVVCLTLGPEGCQVVSPDQSFYLPARPVDVVDTTGAGDAFWSGFLAAYLEAHDLDGCARAGRAMAERKLAHLGPLPDPVSVAELLADQV